MAHGARNRFGAPMFEPEVFREQMYCVEETTCDMLGLFGRPNDSTPGHCSSLPPLGTPLKRISYATPLPENVSEARLK